MRRLSVLNLTSTILELVVWYFARFSEEFVCTAMGGNAISRPVPTGTSNVSI